MTVKTVDECINYLDKQIKNNQNIIQTAYFISIKNHLESLREFTAFGSDNNRWEMIYDHYTKNQIDKNITEKEIEALEEGLCQ